VENLLYRMPGIAEVAAVAAPDAELGERICVFVVPEPGGTSPWARSAMAWRRPG
jgi:2,3-dihydroxybenzoate-AMP ligase